MEKDIYFYCLELQAGFNSDVEEFLPIDQGVSGAILDRDVRDMICIYE